MDFRINFQLKDKNPWWLDVVFYIVISAFVFSIFSYGVLLLKNYQQRGDLNVVEEKLNDIGTEDQKKQEQEVIAYQKKISDFALLLDKHTLASNAFEFIQKNTIEDVWLKQFSLDQKMSQIQLSGQASTLDSFSRQVANFENNEYVKSLGVISSSVDQSNKVNFSFNLAMDPMIFSYGAQITTSVPMIETASSANNKPIVEIVEPTGLSDQKLITSFHLLLSPEVVGTIDQFKRTVVLNVPYGTDVKSLKTIIEISPKAIISPDISLPVDFSNPVIYTITAEDKTAQTYQVTVNVLSKQVQPIVVQPVNTQINIPAIIFISTLILLILIIAGYAISKLIKGPSNQENKNLETK